MSFSEVCELKLSVLLVGLTAFDRIERKEMKADKLVKKKIEQNHTSGVYNDNSS